MLGETSMEKRQQTGYKTPLSFVLISVTRAECPSKQVDILLPQEQVLEIIFYNFLNGILLRLLLIFAYSSHIEWKISQKRFTTLSLTFVA